MTDAVIVSTARTPLAKSWKGSFNMTHGATLGGAALAAAIARAGIEAAQVEDVMMGCANPEGATGWNIARQVALRAGCPVSTGGITINRRQIGDETANIIERQARSGGFRHDQPKCLRLAAMHKGICARHNRRQHLTIFNPIHQAHMRIAPNGFQNAGAFPPMAN